MNLGWIGCGNMGVRMAERLVKAGHPLVVYNRTITKTQRVLDAGEAYLAQSPAEVAAKSNIIFTSITNDQAMKDILEGENGLLKNTREGQILVEMSTLSPDYCGELRNMLRERGMLYLDAPVIGSMFMVEAGLLKILASGDQEAYDAVKPLFDIIGKTSVYMGSGAHARYMKIAVNLMICSYLTIYGEALSAGEGMGFAWEELNNILEASYGASSMLSDKGTTHRERLWGSATALTSTALKDLGLALDCAERDSYDLPLTSVICQYDRFMHFNPKYETFSTFGTIRVLEELAGREPGDYPAVAEDEKSILADALVNALVAATTLLAAEAVTFCRKADIDSNVAIEILGTCHGASVYIKDSREGFIIGKPNGTLTIQECRKSLRKVLDITTNAGIFLPIFAVTSQRLNVAAQINGENADICAILL